LQASEVIDLGISGALPLWGNICRRVQALTWKGPVLLKKTQQVLLKKKWENDWRKKAA